MSSARGAGLTKQRAQKHKNTFAFKNDLHDKTPQMKRINQLHVNEVCERCKQQIEWKIRYKKYKPLSQAKTCIRCNQRTVKKAYHVACKDCARKERCCAKCLQSAEQVAIVPAEPTPREEQILKCEMDRLIKSLPERKRRTFLRYMKLGKEGEKDKDEEQTEVDPFKEPPTAEEIIHAKRQARRKRVPHSRDDLLKKIELLRIAENDDEDDDDELGETDEENTDSDEYDFDSDDVDSEEDDDDENGVDSPAKGLP